MTDKWGANETPTLLNHFKLSMDNESRAAALYVKFEEMFKANEEAADFWDSLKRDELYHLKILKEIFKSLSDEILKQPAEMTTYEDAVKAKINLDKAKLENIKNLDHAFEQAHDLEFSEMNTVFIYLVSKYHYSEEKQDQIIEEIDSHRIKLMDFGAEDRTRSWRQGILADKENIL